MVDTRSRRYATAARRMFWSGIVLFLVGLAALGAARTDGATTWRCDPRCRPVTGTRESVEVAGAVVAGLGGLLRAAAVLMATLRRPARRP
ncbi:hypothetical protein ACQI4E_26460 [Streptomyces sp. CA-252508]|uniref:hypothetical protein n=1 Tax=Streptomyces sp. CA-252508 TaxID=3418946 RepID=UPI003D8F2F23